MVRANTTLVSFSRGELSRKMRGRFDKPQYYAGCERLENFISQTQGPATYRNGTRFVIGTKSNNPAVLLPFQFNEEQSYILEFTNLRLRIFLNEGILLETAQNITNITQANPAVVTYSGADNYDNGKEVFIDDVVGMTQVNGKFFTVANVNTGANTFELSGINSTGFTAYSSGGTVQQVVEVTTPYTTAQLFELQIAQNADTLFIAHTSHEPRELTRTSATVWTLTEQAFTHPPFQSENTTSTTLAPSATTGSGITITASAATFVSTDVGRYVRIDQGADFGFARITAFTSSTSVTADVENDFVSTTAQTTWRLGSFSDTTGFPGAVSFYEQRLVYGGTTNQPQTLFLSKSGDFNDFSTGTEATDGLQFTIGSRDVNLIRWLVGTDRQLVIGTFGGNFIARGGENNEAITPTNISVRPTDGIGAENQIPILHNNRVVFTERGQRTLRVFQFDLQSDGFQSTDLNVESEDITFGGIKQIGIQRGRPQIIWCAKDNGELLGFTYKPSQQVFGWHRHNTREGDEITSVAVNKRPGNFDQLWVVNKRSINGVDQYYVEFLEDPPEFPDRVDFFTGVNNIDSDDLRFRNILFERQKEYVHLDSALSYDGTAQGISAGATITPAAVSGSGVTFTASAGVFVSGDVGREIWKKHITGDESGRARITGFTSSTVVTCTIVSDFDSTSVIAAGNWFLTTNSISGLDHLEGEVVQVVTDGAPHPDETVSSGSITLDTQASTAHIGFSYIGLLRTMNLEVGGVNGPSQTKFKNIYRIGLKFQDTLGALFGTGTYNTEQIQFRSTDSLLDRPPELFSGERLLSFEDQWNGDKHIVLLQQLPLPCSMQLITSFSNTSN